MRILFSNAIENQNVTSLNGSLNYPETSIYHPFLEKKFKSLVSSDTLTIVLDIPVPMNCFFMGFHNVVSGSVSFLDGASAPVGSPISLANASDLFVSYFDEITVKTIIVAIASAGAQVYVGGIGAGVYTEMPDAVSAGFSFDVSDATSISRSPSGQTSRNQSRALRTRTFRFPNINQATKDALDPVILALGPGKPVYCDLFNDDPGNDFDPPMYAMISQARGFDAPTFGRYTLSIVLLEAR